MWIDELIQNLLDNIGSSQIFFQCNTRVLGSMTLELGPVMPEKPTRCNSIRLEVGYNSSVSWS